MKTKESSKTTSLLRERGVNNEPQALICQLLFWSRRIGTASLILFFPSVCLVASKIEAISKPGPAPQTNTVQPDIAYTGLLYHQRSGLQFAAHRAYDSGERRWINRDPTGESEHVNLYNYVANEPTVAVDPSGYCLIQPVVSQPAPPVPIGQPNSGGGGGQGAGNGGVGDNPVWSVQSPTPPVPNGGLEQMPTVGPGPTPIQIGQPNSGGGAGQGSDNGGSADTPVWSVQTRTPQIPNGSREHMPTVGSGSTQIPIGEPIIGGGGSGSGQGSSTGGIAVEPIVPVNSQSNSVWTE